MIEQDLLIRSVISATTDVFSTMLDMEVKYAGEAIEDALAGGDVVSIVGITGDWAGSGVFCCTPGFATTICSRMLGTTIDPNGGAIDDEILDVVAEVTNMMIGNIKNSLEAETGPLAISVPTVIHGRNFHFRNISGLRGTATFFEGDGEKFEVRMQLTPAQQSASKMRVPVFGLAHV